MTRIIRKIRVIFMTRRDLMKFRFAPRGAPPLRLLPPLCTAAVLPVKIPEMSIESLDES